VASGFRLPLPESWRAVASQAASQAEGRKVVLGIRPENIREASRGGATVQITARVEFVEPFGHEVIVHGRVGEDLLVAKTDPHRSPQMGDDFPLVIEADAIHLFDAATEQRLTAS
jgi:multiple sugar transport system ATP-binding protein